MENGGITSIGERERRTRWASRRKGERGVCGNQGNEGVGNEAEKGVWSGMRGNEGSMGEGERRGLRERA